MRRQFQAYQDNAVTTASGPQLTLMLYNGCIKFINQALKDIDENNYESKNKNIQKAQAIIQELMVTLDSTIELSNQFLPLYDYIYYQLQQGNINHDNSYLEEALQYVTEFRDMWKEVIIKAAPKKQIKQGAQV